MQYSGYQSFWQSDIWKGILEDSHQVTEAVWCRVGSRQILLEKRRIGCGWHGIFALGTIGDISESEMTILREAALAMDGVFLQIEPLSGEIFHAYGTPYRAFLTEATRMIRMVPGGEQEIFAAMHEKGRYNIRLAQKRGVKTEWVPPNPENIDIWMQLLEETTDRDGFSGNSRDYYEVFLKKLAHKDAGGLLFAFYEGKVISAGIFVYSDTQAIYYYGASVSDREMRKHMAPYLLQWTAICEGIARSCVSYDFLGVPTPGDDMSTLRGVGAFKEKFGGDIVLLPKKYFSSLSWKGKCIIFLRNLMRIKKKK